MNDHIEAEIQKALSPTIKAVPLFGVMPLCTTESLTQGVLYQVQGGGDLWILPLGGDAYRNEPVLFLPSKAKDEQLVIMARLCLIAN